MINNTRKTTVGIWGFGKVGRSAATLLATQGHTICVYDQHKESISNCPYLTAPSLEAFFDSADYILPSPGIDISRYRSQYAGTWLCELDLFSQLFTKPTIAITGSVGKTTVTHYLAETLKSNGYIAIAAGNIGTPMLDLIDRQANLDVAILELSSFQLEYAKLFAPDLAIWTNFYENHLDRHGTMQNYLLAKSPIIAHQRKNQKALLPYNLKTLLPKTKASRFYFSEKCPGRQILDQLFCLESSTRIHKHPGVKHFPAYDFYSNTMPINQLILSAALELLDIQITSAPIISGMEHRLEKIATVRGMTFYNDSKSTTAASTLAALKNFPNKKITLFLGGLDKGVDREPLIKEIAQSSSSINIVSFGSEAQKIALMCRDYSIHAQAFTQLDQAFFSCMQKNQKSEILLFSPGGSSFDLFKNYIDRGNFFKSLIAAYQKRFS